MHAESVLDTAKSTFKICCFSEHFRVQSKLLYTKTFSFLSNQSDTSTSKPRAIQYQDTAGCPKGTFVVLC